MDPIIATIVAALGAGALASAKDVASQAVKDSYAGLKKVIENRYANAKPSLKALQENPVGAAEQQIVARELTNANASSDAALREAAEQVLDTLKHSPGADALFDFESIVALQRFEVSEIEVPAGQSVFRVRGAARFEGDVRMTGVKQKVQNPKAT